MNLSSFRIFLAGIATLALVSVSSATILYSEAFNNIAADVTLVQQPDTTVQYVDYSNVTIGASNFSVVESPRMIAGSNDTRGILIRANSDDDNAAPAAVNVIAGNTPATFSGDYCVSYDMWLNVPLTENPDGSFSTPAGSTEQGLWGVGVGDFTVESRSTRFAGTMGTWGWIAGDNGYGTEDAAIFEDGTELADLGDTQLGEDAPFNAAFGAPIVPGAPNNAPGNEWVEVDVVVQGGDVTVFYNGVEFFSEASAATEGGVMFGYEDPFSSITDAPDGMWGLFDNFVVKEVIPEPSGGLLSLFLALPLLARRRR